MRKTSDFIGCVHKKLMNSSSKEKEKENDKPKELPWAFTKHENAIFWEYNELYKTRGKLFESKIIPVDANMKQYPQLSVFDLKENVSTTTHDLIKEGRITLNIVTIHRPMAVVIYIYINIIINKYYRIL